MEISLEVISLIINCIRAFYIQKLSNELHININKISNDKFLECVVKHSTKFEIDALFHPVLIHGMAEHS